MLKKAKKQAKKEKKEAAKKAEKSRKVSLSEQQNEDSKRRTPMTKEEWEKQQSVIRKVYDPDTGRHRLVKGSGEILEEIVSYSRHKEINQTATKGDGSSFQVQLNKQL